MAASRRGRPQGKITLKERVEPGVRSMSGHRPWSVPTTRPLRNRRAPPPTAPRLPRTAGPAVPVAIGSILQLAELKARRGADRAALRREEQVAVAKASAAQLERDYRTVAPAGTAAEPASLANDQGEPWRAVGDHSWWARATGEDLATAWAAQAVPQPANGNETFVGRYQFSAVMLGTGGPRRTLPQTASSTTPAVQAAASTCLRSGFPSGAAHGLCPARLCRG